MALTVGIGSVFPSPAQVEKPPDWSSFIHLPTAWDQSMWPVVESSEELSSWVQIGFCGCGLIVEEGAQKIQGLRAGPLHHTITHNGFVPAPPTSFKPSANLFRPTADSLLSSLVQVIVGTLQKDC